MQRCDRRSNSIECTRRWYLIPSLDMWTDVFASVGTRTTGNREGHFVYVPPKWNGSLPTGLTRIDAPTPIIWIMGRVQTDGPGDYSNVHRIQDGFKLTTLPEWSLAQGGQVNHVEVEGSQDVSKLLEDHPEVESDLEPLRFVNGLSGAEFFQRFSKLTAGLY